MKLKYYIQKSIGRLFDSPIIPRGRTFGYSLVRSEKANSIFGKRTKVYPPYFLHNIELGDYSYIAKNSNISNCKIGKFCSIGPNISCGLGKHPTNGISTSPMFYSTKCQNETTLCEQNKYEEHKKIIIGNDVFIGANVTILDGITIADGAIIGAGAVVTKDIPPYAIAAGVPAKVIKYRFSQEKINVLLERKWWNDNENELKRVERDFWDIDKFLSEEK